MQSIHIEPKLPKEVLEKQQKQFEELLNKKAIVQFMLNYQIDEAFIRQHLGRFGKWVEELELCRGCPGLFACRQKRTGYILDLTVEDGVLNNQITKCNYLLDDETQKAHLKYFLINDMSEQLSPLMLKQFDLENETYDYLSLFDQVKSWIQQPTAKGLFLYGPSGSGKTYLLSAVANECAKQGKTVAFINVPTFVSKAKLYFDQPDEMQRLIEQAKFAHVAFFDDIGAESVSDWSRDELLFPIINYRLEANKSTWFSSNEQLDSLKQHYAKNQKGKTSTTKAIRMVERILACANPVLLSEDNRRKK